MRSHEIFSKGDFVMDFKSAVKSVLTTNYANFKGRARRSECWYFYLFSAIVNLVIGILGGLLAEVPVIGIVVRLAITLVLAVMIIPSIAVSFRRLHDIGKSGWWLLIALIPLIGEIVLIVFSVTDSQPGENAYGPNPKGV